MKTATEMNRIREELIAKQKAEREAQIIEFCETEVMEQIETATAHRMRATRVRTNRFTSQEIMDYVQKFGYECQTQGWDIVVSW